MDGKRTIMKYKEEEEEYDEEEEEEEEEDEDGVVRNKKRVVVSDLYNNNNRKRGGGSKGGGSSATPYCQVDGCNEDLSDAKQYHRRHKVCEHHAKAPAVLIAHQHQRFCQQCSRFHELSEFDESKRSCRRRLAGHNERRRKSASDHYQGE